MANKAMQQFRVIVTISFMKELNYRLIVGAFNQKICQ